MAGSRRSSSVTPQLLLGALVTLVGVVLLVDTTGLYDTRFLLDYVPSLFVLLGLYALVRGGLRNFLGPTVVILAALAWQLTALDVLEWGDLAQFWPLALVLFGFSLLFAHFRRTPEGVSDSHVTAFAVFGGSEQRSTSREFTGADLTAVFGGAELDLRDAAVADRPAHVSATALFGGVELIVPREWNVRLEVLPILGAATDDRPRRESEHDEVDLVISGFAAFGGVAVDD